MNDGQWSDIERACRELVAGNATRLRWSWDGRFGAALATFPASDADAALAALGLCLPSRWDHGTVGLAPAAVQDLAEAIGGVRSGQWILSTDPAGDILVVGAWWPWGGGQTLSIRLFPVATGTSLPLQDELTAAFRGWFCP
jgi:hypothetical protein